MTTMEVPPWGAVVYIFTCTFCGCERRQSQPPCLIPVRRFNLINCPDKSALLSELNSQLPGPYGKFCWYCCTDVNSTEIVVFID